MYTSITHPTNCLCIPIRHIYNQTLFFYFFIYFFFHFEALLFKHTINYPGNDSEISVNNCDIRAWYLILLLIHKQQKKIDLSHAGARMYASQYAGVIRIILHMTIFQKVRNVPILQIVHGCRCFQILAHKATSDKLWQKRLLSRRVHKGHCLSAPGSRCTQVISYTFICKYFHEMEVSCDLHDTHFGLVTFYQILKKIIKFTAWGYGWDSFGYVIDICLPTLHICRFFFLQTFYPYLIVHMQILLCASCQLHTAKGNTVNLLSHITLWSSECCYHKHSQNKLFFFRKSFKALRFPKLLIVIFVGCGTWFDLMDSVCILTTCK